MGYDPWWLDRSETLSSVIEWNLVDNLEPLKNKENYAKFYVEN